MIIIVILILGFKPFATAADPLKQDCRTSNGYPVRGPYEQNLDLLSAALSRNASSTPTTHFAKGSVGAYPSTAYGLALCRGDNASASACGDCVATAFEEGLRLCGHNKDAHLMYETCVLRFSNQDFISYRASNVRSNLLIVPEPPLSGWDPSDAKSVDTINGIVKVLLNETARQTAYNSTTARYATILMDGNDAGFPPLYSLAQCAPDLPPSDCWDCLWSIYDDTRTSFSVRQGGRIAGIWCDFRYSTHQFYQGQPMRRIATPDAVVRTTKPPPPPPRPAPVVPNQHKRRPVKVLVIATVVPLLALFFCFIFCFWLIRRHRKGKVSIHEDEALVWVTEGSSEFKFFNFSQVSDATSNFSDENKLGQGGFGPVYKGQLPDGLEIAIKRLASHSGQGFTEFKNEVQLIAKLQHTNLVRLLGCCSQGEEKILIYEYLPNKSLDFFIFDETRRALLNWNNRLAIIEGIAQGLLYLHKHSRPRVIHRDLKASNILLDSEMKPKISDFGLAKIFNTNDTEGNTKTIAGTYGYMAPEYASEGIFSVKSDVFSFGVLTLEIISGTRNSGFYQHGNFFNLLGYAWKLWREGRWLELIDGPLVLEIDALKRMRCVNIALLCVQENAADRPTMSDVIAMLSSDSMTLLDPKHPAYFHVTVTKDGGSTAAAEPSTVNDVTISILNGR